MDRIINLPLLAHPLNWGIVISVLLLTGYAFTVIVEAVHGNGCNCADA